MINKLGFLVIFFVVVAVSVVCVMLKPAAAAVAPNALDAASPLSKFLLVSDMFFTPDRYGPIIFQSLFSFPYDII
ncbi:hypothetical protein SEH50133_21314 [Salmonella enterica subsp. houtenae serovar 50:g,z51:- str. 01-0133]|nr:hypothetical protein SEH50133_21314 [Salmonella enterica subsp. houtenae serovar 50:g,z51:- str. 01-0133]